MDKDTFENNINNVDILSDMVLNHNKFIKNEFDKYDKIIIELQNRNTELQNRNTELQNRNTALQNKLDKALGFLRITINNNKTYLNKNK